MNSGDIESYYVNAPVTKKIWTNLGEDFGADAGKKAIIVRAIYGFKSSGDAFRNHLVDCMRHIGYTSCLADLYLWMKPMIKSNSECYYSYIFNHVDDVLVISEGGGPILARLGKYFKLKSVSIGPPANYLVTNLCLARLPNGVVAWGMSQSQYVQEATKFCKKHVDKIFKGKYI